MADFSNLFYLPFQIGKATFTGLLDSGASRSFISGNYASCLGSKLQSIDDTPVTVTLPNGAQLTTTKKYRLDIMVESKTLAIELFELDME